VRQDLPAGTVTFLFTDVEGSTRLLEEIGDEAYEEALSVHRRIVRAACQAHDGVEVDTQGDAFFFAFSSATAAASAASATREALAPGPIHVRIGLHTGTPRLTDEGYVGKDVHFAARVAATGHGGQIVLSKATAELVELPLTELGEHRLKDIEHAVAIFQLGSESFPPLKTISNTNLPRPPSSFVGREVELAEVLAEIEHGVRLLTLTGPGGSGKTRLALEAAVTLVPEYKAGVFWVGLASLRDPSLVTEQISQTLGAKDGLSEHVGEREMLLLIDNLEQVVEAAPELSRLLHTCPNLALLCTSRELLRVQGEVEYEVPPLAEPQAVTLFCERSRLEASEEIAELCARLDNLPLAVELAAARTKALTPGQILDRIAQRFDLLKGSRDADPRQQTLRATIAWSYDLLSREEQRLFRALSVFAGGCTLEAAEEVCDAALDTLQSLVEKSLLRFFTGRYWMLETIREFAQQQWAACEADDVRRRHAEWVLELAEQAESGMEGPEGLSWHLRLEQEQDNLRAAFAFMEKTGRTGAQLELVGRIWEFWEKAGLFLEGRRWTESALSRSDAERSARRAKALRAAAVCVGRLGESAEAKALAEESLSIFAEIGDAKHTAWALDISGGASSELGDEAESERLREQARRQARVAGETRIVALATLNLSDSSLRQGDYGRAMTLSEEAVALCRELGMDKEHALALQNLALGLLRSGQEKEAYVAAAESLTLSGYVWARAMVLALLGSVAAQRGDAEVGTRLLGAAAAVWERMSLPLTGAEADLYHETVEELRATLGRDLYDAVFAEGEAMALEDAVAYALCNLE
jgi:predicted ATPase